MNKRPNILVAGILDTKGQEIKFLANRVKAAGGEPTVLELSVGCEVGWADISVGRILQEVGRNKEDVFSLDRGKASAIIVEGAKEIAAQLLAEGKLDGMISYGGSMGASMATRIMQSLPLGIPKLMLTTMASGDVSPYVGTKDICMMYPIAEAGLNKVTRTILNNAAGAVAGMASSPKLEVADERPPIGCMMFGAVSYTHLTHS